MSINSIPRKFANIDEILETAEYCVKTVENLENQAQSKDAIFSLPSKIEKIEKQLSSLKCNTLPPDQNPRLKDSIAKVESAITRIRAQLSKTKDTESQSLKQEVESFIASSSLRLMTQNKIRETFERFMKRRAELETMGPDKTLKTTQELIDLNSEWVIECGKPTDEDVPPRLYSHSSSSSHYSSGTDPELTSSGMTDFPFGSSILYSPLSLVPSDTVNFFGVMTSILSEIEEEDVGEAIQRSLAEQSTRSLSTGPSTIVPYSSE